MLFHACEHSKTWVEDDLILVANAQKYSCLLGD